MNIKKKIRDLRVYLFVNRCKKDELNYEVYYPRLYNIDKFPKLIRKINRLSPVEKEYVLSPLKSMKYGLNADDVYMIMQDQINIVKKRREYGIIDLSKLYLSTVHVSKYIYEELVHKYINNIPMGSYQAKDYIYQFIRKPYEFILNSPEFNPISIGDLAPDKLRQALKHNRCGSKFLTVYHSLSKEGKQNINKMSEEKFQKVLDFLFNGYDQDDFNYNFQARKKLLRGLDCISEKIDSVRLFPDHLIDSLYFECTSNSRKYFFDHIHPDSVGWIKELSNTPEAQASNIKNIIERKRIFNLPCEYLEEIFKNVRKVGHDDETNISRYKAKMKFLIDDHGGFASDVGNINLLKYTLHFICQNDSELVLSQKFNALNALREELRHNLIDDQLYKNYLSFLDEGLENKSEKEKIRQIRARSRYFENHTLSDFMEQLQNKPQQEKLKTLLQQNQKPKKMVQNYRFISMSDHYQSDIVDIIVKILAEIEDVNCSKMILSYIKSEQFKNLSIEKQKEHLTVLVNILKEEQYRSSVGQKRVKVA